MKWLLALLALLGTCFNAPVALAQEEISVDLELVLAVDVSRSMTPRELEIQRRGYAEALASAEVVQAITGGIYGQIAITYVEWAGYQSQRVVVGWSLIRSSEDAAAFAMKLTAHFNESMRRTSISSALDYSRGLFNGNGYKGLRRVIDVSGDGPNNAGRPVTFARDDTLAAGIVINGLPLMTREGMGSRWSLEDLDRYYYYCVIGGPGSFVIPVLEWNNFPEAVRKKLVLEIAWQHRQPPHAGSMVAPVQAEGYDCLIGEKIMQSIIDERL